MACRARAQARGRARLHLYPVLEHVAGARAIQVERGRGRDVERRRRVSHGLDIHNHGVPGRQCVRHARIQCPGEALAAQQRRVGVGLCALSAARRASRSMVVVRSGQRRPAGACASSHRASKSVYVAQEASTCLALAASRGADLLAVRAVQVQLHGLPLVPAHGLEAPAPPRPRAAAGVALQLHLPPVELKRPARRRIGEPPAHSRAHLERAIILRVGRSCN